MTETTLFDNMPCYNTDHLISIDNVGSVYVCENFFYDLTIKEEYRRQGYGTKLVEQVCEYAKANGFNYIECACDEDNAIAWAFYRKLNFKVLFVSDNLCILRKEIR